MNDLKPCPFCGGKAHIATTHVIDGGEFAEVTCCDCYAFAVSEREFLTEDEAVASAVAAWNRRAGD